MGEPPLTAEEAAQICDPKLAAELAKKRAIDERRDRERVAPKGSAQP